MNEDRLIQKAREIREKIRTQEDVVPFGGRYSQMGGEGLLTKEKSKAGNAAWGHLQRLREEEAESLEERAMQMFRQKLQAKALREK